LLNFAPHFANRHDKKTQAAARLRHVTLSYFSMYVIVDIQGQQFKVQQDQKLFVHRINADQGAEVEFEKVMLVDNDGAVTVVHPSLKEQKW